MMRALVMMEIHPTVTAFPLAPLFALFNNFLEIMETVGWISIITNALIIAITSEFIPKAVYLYHYSQDQSLAGYVEFSLSRIDMFDIDAQAQILPIYLNATCRYPDFMTEPGEMGVTAYSPNIKFWHIWFARLLFV